MINLSSLKVAGKLYVMILLAAAGIVAIAGTGHRLLGKAMDRGEYVLVNTIPSFNALNQARVAMLRMMVLARDHVLETDGKRMAELDTRIAEQRATIDTALRTYEKSLISDEEDRRLLGMLSAAITDFYRGLEIPMQLSRSNAGNVSTEAREALGKMPPRVRKVDEAFDRMLAYNESLWSRSSEEAKAARADALLVTVLLTGVILSLLGILAGGSRAAKLRGRSAP